LLFYKKRVGEDVIKGRAAVSISNKN